MLARVVNGAGKRRSDSLLPAQGVDGPLGTTIFRAAAASGRTLLRLGPLAAGVSLREAFSKKRESHRKSVSYIIRNRNERHKTNSELIRAVYAQNLTAMDYKKTLKKKKKKANPEIRKSGNLREIRKSLGNAKYPN